MFNCFYKYNTIYLKNKVFDDYFLLNCLYGTYIIPTNAVTIVQNTNTFTIPNKCSAVLTISVPIIPTIKIANKILIVVVFKVW